MNVSVNLESEFSTIGTEFPVLESMVWPQMFAGTRDRTTLAALLRRAERRLVQHDPNADGGIVRFPLRSSFNEFLLTVEYTHSPFAIKSTRLENRHGLLIRETKGSEWTPSPWSTSVKVPNVITARVWLPQTLQKSASHSVKYWVRRFRCDWTPRDKLTGGAIVSRASRAPAVLDRSGSLWALPGSVDDIVERDAQLWERWSASDRKPSLSPATRSSPRLDLGQEASAWPPITEWWQKERQKRMNERAWARRHCTQAAVSFFGRVSGGMSAPCSTLCAKAPEPTLSLQRCIGLAADHLEVSLQALRFSTANEVRRVRGPYLMPLAERHLDSPAPGHMAVVQNLPRGKCLIWGLGLGVAKMKLLDAWASNRSKTVLVPASEVRRLQELHAAWSSRWLTLWLGLGTLVAALVIGRAFVQRRKRLAVALLGLTLSPAFLASCDSAASSTNPVVSIAPESLDVGRIRTGQRVKTAIQVSNYGSRPVWVRREKRSCTCVDLAVSELRVAPGSSANLPLLLTGPKPGAIDVEMRLAVSTDRSFLATSQLLRLRVVGKVFASAVVAPEHVFVRSTAGTGNAGSWSVREPAPRERQWLGAPSWLRIGLRRVEGEEPRYFASLADSAPIGVFELELRSRLDVPTVRVPMTVWVVPESKL